MSLVRLLTAGKSLVGIQDSKSRYRSVDPRAMPKFGSDKKTNTDVARESEALTRVEKTSAKVNVGTAGDRDVRAPSSNGKTVEKMPVTVEQETKGSGWVSRWGSKLSSLVSQKPKPARGTIPRFNGPVQGELSLDNIKVIRNDLSDADLEVVTRRATAKKGDMPEQAMPTVANGNNREETSALASAVEC